MSRFRTFRRALRTMWVILGGFEGVFHMKIRDFDIKMGDFDTKMGVFDINLGVFD
jgi:hypothetical protein